MKTSSIFLITALLLFPFCMTKVFAQKKSADVEKKITIIKRTIEADGTEINETIVKKGKAAENFDVDKYVKENTDDKTQVEVTVNDIAIHDGKNSSWCQNMDWSGEDNGSYLEYNSSGAFLGVEEDSDEKANEAGLVIQVVRGSGAEKAGLRHNDKILQLNGVKIDKWSDLTKFVNAAKPGDKVKVSYNRNGIVSTTEATLTTRGEVDRSTSAPTIGFMGVSDNNAYDGVKGGATINVVNGSGAEKAGLEDGDVLMKINDTPIMDYEDITDFMAYTKPGEKLTVTYRRDGAEKNAEILLSEPQKTSYSNYSINSPKFEIKQLGDGTITCSPKINCQVKEKEACLGVYSNEGEAEGSTIQSFTTESAAREAGMLEKDLILSVNGHPVHGHSELWDEIAKYKTGDQVDVAYRRDGKSLQVKATLKACRNNQSRVDVIEETQNGPNNRRFYTWDWNDGDQRRLRETRIIIIRRAGEGDAAKVNSSPNNTPAPQERNSLQLRTFKAFPNPSQGQVTVEFSGEAVPTVVSLFDLAGRQLFREELNSFNGEYSQQFDLTAYAKGNIMIHVQQGDAVYTEQIVVN